MPNNPKHRAANPCLARLRKPRACASKRPCRTCRPSKPFCQGCASSGRSRAWAECRRTSQSSRHSNEGCPTPWLLPYRLRLPPIRPGTPWFSVHPAAAKGARIGCARHCWERSSDCKVPRCMQGSMRRAYTARSDTIRRTTGWRRASASSRDGRRAQQPRIRGRFPARSSSSHGCTPGLPGTSSTGAMPTTAPPKIFSAFEPPIIFESGWPMILPYKSQMAGSTAAFAMGYFAKPGNVASEADTSLGCR